MSLLFLADALLIILCTSSCFIAIIYLGTAVIYRHRCFNFYTVLACNTCVTIFFLAAISLTISIYMLIWNVQGGDISPDPLCGFQAFIFSWTASLVFYSCVLQTIQRYYCIKGLYVFNDSTKKILLVAAQWILSCIVNLPLYLTGYYDTFLLNNMCFLAWYNAGLIVYHIFILYVAPNTMVIVLYHLIYRHIQQTTPSTSVIAENIRQMHNRRELSMIRRILITEFIGVSAGIPYIILICIGWVAPSYMPPLYFHIGLLGICCSLPMMLIILLWNTPDLKESVILLMKKCQQLVILVLNNRVIPIINNTRA